MRRSGQLDFPQFGLTRPESISFSAPALVQSSQLQSGPPFFQPPTSFSAPMFTFPPRPTVLPPVFPAFSGHFTPQMVVPSGGFVVAPSQPTVLAPPQANFVVTPRGTTYPQDPRAHFENHSPHPLSQFGADSRDSRPVITSPNATLIDQIAQCPGVTPELAAMIKQLLNKNEKKEEEVCDEEWVPKNFTVPQSNPYTGEGPPKSHIVMYERIMRVQKIGDK